MISEPELLIRLVLTVVLGAFIGFERERVDKPAGLRTHILVALGSTQFTLLSLYAFPTADPARIAAYIVAGIGFIGAGAIIQTQDRVTGVTTAASLWVTASMGMAVGTGYYILALVVALLSFITLQIRWMEKKLF